VISEAIFAGTAEAVVKHALDQAGVFDWLRKRGAKQAFQGALHSAYQTWAEADGHAKWAASLFDESFLRHEGAPILAQLLLRDGHPDPSDLAARWADSLNVRQPEQRTTYTRDLEPAAADFLDRLAHQLKQLPEFQAQHDSRALDQLVEITRALRLKLGAGDPTPGTRWDYLRWITDSNLYLDLRGVAQTQRQVQVKLDEVYISLQAQREETLSPVDRRLLEQDLLELEQELDAHAPAEKREDLEDQVRRDYELRYLRGNAAGAVESLDLGEVVRRHDRLVILGDPGCGKSTLLRFLALRHGQALRRGQTDAGDGLGPARFPILLRIAEYAEDGRWKKLALSEYLDDYCRLHECSTTGLAGLLAAELAGGNCLVLLDGLDEIVNAGDRLGIVNRIEDFVLHYGSQANRYVITSRIAGYRSAPLSGPFTHYTVRDMDLPQIERFLHRWCQAVEAAQTPDLAAELRAAKAQAEIDGILKAMQLPGVRRLASNPLLLCVLALIHHTGAQLPQKRIELYKLAAHTLARSWSIAKGIRESALPPEEQLTQLLGTLAYWLHVNKPAGIATEADVYTILGKEWANVLNLPWDEDHPNLAVDEKVRKFLLQVREHTGLFLERAPHRYGFMHLTFEEYYAARYLVARSAKAPELIRGHLHDPRWDEPILLALGFKGLDYPDDAADLFATAILARGEDAQKLHFAPSPYEDILGRDYLFALRCLGDLIPAGALGPELIDRLAQELLHRRGPAQYTQYRAALNERLGLLAASELAADLATRLSTALADPDAQVRRAAAGSLGRLGQASPEVVAALLQALADPYEGVRRAAAESLGWLGQAGPEVVAALLRAIADHDKWVRGAAADSLGRLGQVGPEAVAFPLRTLADPDAAVRGAAAESLGRLGQVGPEARSELLEMLRSSPDWTARHEAARLLALHYAGGDELIDVLLQGLLDDDNDVRTACGEGLARIGQQRPSMVATIAGRLLQCLQHPDFDKRDKIMQRPGRDYAYDALWQLIAGTTKSRRAGRPASRDARPVTQGAV